jgi:hypothetical protein
MEIKPSLEGTHERLREVLITYYERILPYIQKRGDPELGQQFFVQFNSVKGLFRAFKDAPDYVGFFSGRVGEFFKVQELEPHLRDKINPHFLRGVCTDWMILDLHMTFEEAAEVLGDSEEVLKRDYLDRNRVYDATAPFNRVNAAHLTEVRNGGAAHSHSSDAQIEQGFQDVLRSKNSEIKSLKKTFKLVVEQLTREIAALKDQIATAQPAGMVITATG